MSQNDADDDGSGRTVQHPAHAPSVGADVGLELTDVRQSGRQRLAPPVEGDFGLEATDAGQLVRPPSVGADLGVEPTHVRTSSPAEPGVERTAVRKVHSAEHGRASSPAEPGVEHTAVRKVHSDEDPLIGAMLGEYRVLAPLGAGGVGLVYRGE